MPLSLVDVLYSRETLLASYCAVEDLHLKEQLAFLFLKQLQSVKFENHWQTKAAKPLQQTKKSCSSKYIEMSSSKGTLLFPTSAYLSLFFSIFPLLMILDQTLKEFCKVKIPHCLSVGTEHLKLPVQRQKKSNEDSRTSELQYKAQSIPTPSQGRRQNCN